MNGAGGAGSTSGTVAVLLHGLCSGPDELLSVASALRSAGHTVRPLLIEGYSFDATLTFLGQRQRARRFEDWLAQIERELDALRTQHARVVLVGISAGATLALAAALRRPHQIDALVLMSLTLLTDGWAVPPHQCLLPLALYTPLGRLWRYTERTPYGVKDERVRQWVERQLRERRLSSAGAAVLEVAHLRENHRLTRWVKRQRGAALPMPVLALHALEDEVASPANLDWLARQLRCAALQTVLLNDCYHMISIDKQRRRVAADTVAFIDAICTERVAA